MSKLLLWKSQTEVACRSSTGLFIGAQKLSDSAERGREREREIEWTPTQASSALYIKPSVTRRLLKGTSPLHRPSRCWADLHFFYAHSARTNRESSEFINKKKRETGERHGHDNLYAIHRWISAVRGAGEVSICRCFSVKIDVFIILVVHVCGTAVC